MPKLRKLPWQAGVGTSLALPAAFAVISNIEGVDPNIKLLAVLVLIIALPVVNYLSHGKPEQ